MKAINLKAKSWHVWVAKTLTGFDDVVKLADAGRLNICRYMRRVFLGILVGLFMVCGLTFIAFVVLGPQLYLIGYLIECIKAYRFLPLLNPMAMAALMIDVSALCVLAFCFVVSKIIDLKNRRVKEDSEIGFVRASYRSIKDKICFKVNLN